MYYSYVKVHVKQTATMLNRKIQLLFVTVLR